jgi:hypothetical protein
LRIVQDLDRRASQGLLEPGSPPLLMMWIEQDHELTVGKPGPE